MGSSSSPSTFIAILAICFLVLQPIYASPTDGLCQEVYCGNGSCKASPNYTFSYICECESGWKHTLFDNDEDTPFFPCVVPNCTVDNSSCNNAPPPTPAEINEPPMNNLNDDLCKEVYCGKGSCKASPDYAFSYICECEPGWKHTIFNNDGDIPFAPCVIPNCTLDYSCIGAPHPAPEIKELPINDSYDPCYYAYCGEGSCKKSTKYVHTCKCKDGYTNLLNLTSFPCFSQCVLGLDCGRLGITVFNDSSTASNKTGSYATSILPGSYLWLTILIISVGFVIRK